MASIFGMVNGYEQVGEKPAPYQPPGAKSSNPLDLKGLRDGLTSAAQGLAKQVAAGVGASSSADGSKSSKLPEHHRPPSTTWDQKPGTAAPAFQTSFQNSSPAGLGPGGVVGPSSPHANPYDDPANGPNAQESMNLGNKYARSYSSKNPPPRASDLAEAEAERAAAVPSFMDELGMDKEPTRKEKKKKLQKIAENPGCLVEAASRGDAAEVRELVSEYEMPPDQRKEEGDGPTPLVAAVLKGHEDVVKVLVKHGADVEVVDGDGNRPLHLAASRGYAEVARRLCKAKADKAAHGQSGATPLHLACRKGREEVVEVLVEAGASLEAVDLKGSFPLHAAAAGGHEEIVEFLLENGADPTAKDAKGKTAKSVASKKGYEDIAKTIKRAIKEKREEEEEESESD